PHLGGFTLNHLFRGFDGSGQTTVFQLRKDERLEQFQRHFLRQTTLVQTQLRTHGNYGTTRVVHALTQQVLTETTLLTFDHVSQRFQRTLVGTGDRTTATTVIQQGVDRFLQHTLFVAHDDVRRVRLEQTDRK